MNSKELSNLYFVTCNEIHEITSKLYEDLHKDNGEPINNWEQVIDTMLDYRKGVLAEIEGVRSACEEYNESKVKL